MEIWPSWFKGIVPSYLFWPSILIMIFSYQTGIHSASNSSSLDVILEFSPFDSVAAIEDEINKIKKTGCRFILFNLASSKNKCELDFETDPKDIRATKVNRGPDVQEPPKDETSLRAYAAILFSKASLFVYIRGKLVRQKPLKWTLYHPEEAVIDYES